MTKKHILVISQYFYPEQFRINDICTEWIKRGYDVTVLTGIPNYPQGKFYEGYGFREKRREQYNGVNIIRIPIIPRGNKSIMLMLNYLSFVVTGFFWKLFTRLKSDCVFIYEVSPMTQALPGIWYARKRKIPCYLYVTDLWPENVEIAGGVKNKTVLRVIGSMVDYVYKNCKHIFTSSESFINSIVARGVSKEKVTYWPQYAEDFYKPVEKSKSTVQEIADNGSFNITFAGNIGFAQGLDILPIVAEKLKIMNIDVTFNIIGDGRYKNTLVSLVDKHNVKSAFNFIEKQPPDRIPEYFAISDAALICLCKNDVYAMTLPAKMQSCLACGIPIIVSADGEIQKVINDASAGLCSDAGDVEGLTQSIVNLASLPLKDLCDMGNNAIMYSNKYFNKETLLSQMDKWLQ